MTCCDTYYRSYSVLDSFSACLGGKVDRIFNMARG